MKKYNYDNSLSMMKEYRLGKIQIGRGGYEIYRHPEGYLYTRKENGDVDMDSKTLRLHFDLMNTFAEALHEK